MRHYWWIIRTALTAFATECDGMPTEKSAIGPYWSCEEAEKVLTLWT